MHFERLHHVICGYVVAVLWKGSVLFNYRKGLLLAPTSSLGPAVHKRVDIWTRACATRSVPSLHCIRETQWDMRGLRRLSKSYFKNKAIL